MAVAALALVPCALVAGPASTRGGSLRFARLSVEDGLSQSSVENILQDRYGFLWFGTQEGLNRYDGYRFVVHRPREEPGFLANAEITSLIEDRRGDLWVGTAGGLHHLDLATGRFRRLAVPAVSRAAVVAAVEDADGRIWFSTPARGLWLVEPREQEVELARRVELGALPANASVTALARGADSSIWAACDGSLLEIRIEGREPRADVALTGLGAVSALEVDGSGRVWIGRIGAGLLRYDPGLGTADRFPQVPRNVLALLAGASGGLWVGARDGGLSRLDPDTGEVVTYRHDPSERASLSEDDVAELYEDRGGNLWIGTWNGGVSRLDPYAQAFHTLRHDDRVRESLPDDDVTRMVEAPDGRLWLGSRNGVLAVGDPRTRRFRAVGIELLAHSRLTGLAYHASRVLVGTTHGLMAIDPASGRRLHLSDPMLGARLDSLPVAAIEVDAGGALWIASERILLRAGPDRALERHELPIESDVSALLATPRNTLWIASESGELVAGEPFDSRAGLRLVPFGRRGGGDSPGARGFITSLHEQADGQLWLGTRNGLGRLDPETGAVAWIDRRHGMPSPNVAGIAADPDGFLWLATNRGITRLTPDTGAMSHFGSLEGAQGSGYADRACVRGDSGLFYFAGRGVTVFDPRDVVTNPHPPGSCSPASKRCIGRWSHDGWTQAHRSCTRSTHPTR